MALRLKRFKTSREFIMERMFKKKEIIGKAKKEPVQANLENIKISLTVK
jgi:hypothetical protein